MQSLITSISGTLGQHNTVLETFSVADLQAGLEREVCWDIPFPSCQACFFFDNLNFTALEIDACLFFNYSCSENSSNVELGCFGDTLLIPDCFAGCEDNCNFQGVCWDGTCRCGENHSGATCNYPACLNNCNGNGTCVDGVCECFEEGMGEYCATIPPSEDLIESDDDNNAAIIAGVVGGVGGALVIVGAVALACWIRKRRKFLNFLPEENSQTELASQ
jgi:hypothetical protein